VLREEIEPPSKHRPEVSPEVDAVVMRAIQRNPAERYQTAREFANALEKVVAAVGRSAVGDWVLASARDAIQRRAESVLRVESDASQVVVPPTPSSIPSALLEHQHGPFSSLTPNPVAANPRSHLPAGLFARTRLRQHTVSIVTGVMVFAVCILLFAF